MRPRNTWLNYTRAYSVERSVEGYTPLFVLLRLVLRWAIMPVTVKGNSMAATAKQSDPTRVRDDDPLGGLLLTTGCFVWN